MSKCPVHHHGMSKAKGCSHARLGNFGKLFPKLKGLTVSEEQAAALGGLGSPMHDQSNSSGDSNMPAGYTFFAQFIDHDITLDTTSDIEGEPLSNTAIEALPNMRTPTLDLDSVYGFGPEASPHLYEGASAPGRLLAGNSSNPDDLARNENGTAMIGDPRNDENIFLSQLHLLFIRFHNKIYDSLASSVSLEHRFEEAQTITRHHYQYLVVNDLLARICDTKIFKFAMKSGFPLIYKADKHGNLSMPVEFSVAAYRFGHVTVRSRYAINSRNHEVDLFDERFGTLGFTSLPTDLVVDWRFMLDIDQGIPPLLTKAFDIQFPDELMNMPSNVVGRDASANHRSLAFRNLRRGNALSLPSGQSVVTALNAAGYPISTNFTPLKLSKIIPDGFDELSEETPLFFYLMREAETLGNGQKLGPAGSAILLEVFLGILNHCETSFLNHKNWKPLASIAGKDGKFELADVVKFVQN